MFPIQVEVTGVLQIPLPFEGPLSEHDRRRIADCYSDSVIAALLRELVVNGKRVNTHLVSCSVKVQEPE